jgi:L-2-hydroxyglutarate oxidase LhgO
MSSSSGCAQLGAVAAESRKNGVADVARISAAEARAREPHLSGTIAT